MTGLKAVAVAARGKGAHNIVRRAREIRARYGLAPGRMADRLTTILDVTEPFGYRATLPVPAVVLARYPHVISRYAVLGVEFAVHGYYHVDHRLLPAHEQADLLGRARRILATHELDPSGFRAPYLRWNDATLDALRAHGYEYDSSQAVHWPLEPGLETDAYRRGLEFQGALDATSRPVVPRLDRGLVRIPYVLPDDESVVDRLHLSPGAITELWLRVLHDTHERGELFTVGVHPERIERCRGAIEAVLRAARSLHPQVWIASHREIARWWRERSAATVEVHDDGADRLCVRVCGPRSTTVLARGLDVREREPWHGGYARVSSLDVVVPARPRPFVGLHPRVPDGLAAFLREQGYVVERSGSPAEHAVYVDRVSYDPADQRTIIDEIEATRTPLLRLGRWPDGARSAVSITGDLDALTLRDYALRLVGR